MPWLRSCTGLSAESNTVCLVRVCFITTTSFDRDPRALAEVNATRAVGHEVVGVSARPSALDWAHPLSSPSLLQRLDRQTTEERLASAAASTGADLFVPVQPAAISAASKASARRQSSSYLNKPTWDHGGRDDLSWRAPHEPGLSLPALGLPPASHIPGGQDVHTGGRGPIAIVYRRSDRTPGRYLEAAFRRTAVETIHLESLDWSLITKDVAGVVIVESPLPALAVSGSNPGVPVVFWVHHGEHHVDANVRLQRRYGANVIALAHSWHLGYRFGGLVERLPFGVAPEITDSSFRPHSSRTFDVAFVGSRSGGARYARREKLLDEARARFGERVRALSDVSPEQMMHLYCDSRIVPDDGVGRHLPITMRFFEAAGAGALLLTRETPGMSLLLEPGTDYVPMDDDGLDQLVDLVEGETEQVGLSGHASIWARHTYDDRVQELFQMMERARSLDLPAPRREFGVGGVAAAVAAFADAQRVLDLEAGVGAQLRDREVWAYSEAEQKAQPGAFQISVVAGGSVEERRRAVGAARLAVVAPSALANEIGSLVTSVHGEHLTFESEDVIAFTYGSSGYRVSSAPDAGTLRPAR